MGDPNRVNTRERERERERDALSQRTNVRRLVTSEDTPSVAIDNNPLEDSMSCTSLTAAWMEVFVFSFDLFVPALFETFEFSFRGNILSAPWSKTLCVLSHSGFGHFFAIEHCRKL